MIASIQGSLAATSFACSRSGLPQRPQARVPQRRPQSSPTNARLATRPTLPRFKPFTASTAIRRAEGAPVLIKRAERQARRGTLASMLPAQASDGVDRRSFLRRSGLAAGGLAALGTLPLGTVRKAEAGPPPPPRAAVTVRKNVCTHCSVGCTVIAHVANGVWIEQEPAWDSPINRGSHCAKGAAVRDDVSSERRLRYPVKLVDGAWQRISWDQAIEEIGTKLLEIRAKSGPDSVYWLGSAKFTNEAAYLNRKFAAFWGTNNSDHQARICHSTTVAGVANTWGYGAMTNSYNDIRNTKTIMIMGGNPAEAHPLSLHHFLAGKELNRPNMIVIHPRSRARRRTPPNMFGFARGYTFRPFTGCSGTFSTMAGKTKNSSVSASTAWTRSARRPRSGRLPRSSA